MTSKEKAHQEAIEHLRKVLKPGDTVYTVLRHVSRSGMSRGIDLYRLAKDDNTGQCAPVWITAYVGHAIDNPQSRKDWERSQGLRVTGCGMDMGFHVVNSLNYALFPEGYQCIGKDCHASDHFNQHTPKDAKQFHAKDGYALKHQWL